MSPMSQLHVAYIGNREKPWCSEVHIARDLEHLGHRVTFFQEPLKGTISQQLKFMADFEQWCAANRPDIAMWTRTRGLPNQASSMWRRLEQIGIDTCSYHLDLYLGLDRERGIERDPFWATHHVFTPDGNKASAAHFKRRHIRHHWMPPAVVSDECVPGTKRDKYAYDVVFVGSEGYHREWPWRGQLVAFLRERYGDKFRHFGNSAPEGQTRGQDLNDLYASAKIVVGDSLNLPGNTHYWTDRYFETVGRGGFLIAPRIEAMNDFLRTHEHYVSYNHPTDRHDPAAVSEALESLGHQIDYWLTQPKERKAIAKAGQEHVRQNHTYKHRLTEMLKVMGFEDVAPKFIDKLELGSGYNPTPGFTHLDMNPDTKPDIVGSAWPLQLADQSVGEIKAVDVLEHLSYMDSAAILADWFRVLAPGGKLFVQVPDADTIMHWYVEQPQRLVERLPEYLPQTPLAGATWRLFGGHRDGVYAKPTDDYRLNAHYAAFSEPSLRAALVAAGFEVEKITVNPHPNLLAYARRPE